MNLSVLKYAAALTIPAVLSGAATTLTVNKLTNRQPKIKSSEWVYVNAGELDPIKVLSIRL